MGDTTPDLGSTLAEDGAEAPPRFGARYRLLRVLGHGGMGNVYLAVDEALGAEVALKRVIAPGDALARLRDEVRLAQKVTHRNVCRTYDLEEIDGTWLVKMEYVAGATLAERLRRGRLPVDTAVHVAREICAGLAAAHREGVVHRDLKPQNVLIEERTGRVVLMDFGIARAAELAGKTSEHISGTPGYMAPEQARGREVDGRADLYALGRVLEEMLPERAPTRLRRLAARLLDDDPDKRPRSADEVAAELAGGKRRWLWPLAAVVLAAAAVVAARPAKTWQPQIRALESFAEDSDFPVLSPDGTQFAYASDRDETGRYRVFVAPVAGGAPRPITPRELDATAPRWTHDGKQILFRDVSKRPGRILRIAVDGGAPELVADDATLAADCAGRLVILYHHAAGCPQCPRFALREPGRPERDLLRLAAGGDLIEFRCDRAGQRVLYALADRHEPGYAPYDLWLLPLDGGPPRRLTTDRAVNLGTFTPDGRSIVFSARHEGRFHLWEMPVDGGRAPVQLTFGQQGELEPDVAPDGRSVLYEVEVGSPQLFAQPLAGGPARRLTSGEKSASRGLEPTPDGRAIITELSTPTEYSQIVSIPLAGGDPVPLVKGALPALTPDGAEVLYAVEDRVMALPLGGGRTRFLTRAPGTFSSLVVGPDGRVHMMVVRASGFEAWSAPVAGGDAERELPAPWSFLWPAPRGGWRAVLQLVQDAPNRVRLLPPGASLDDPGAREISGDGGAWTPDGRSFLYVLDGRIHRLWPETGEDRDIAQASGSNNIAVSADGQTLFSIQAVSYTRRELITNFAER